MSALPEMSARERQTERDREYVAEWLKMTPAKRGQLAKAGITAPALDQQAWDKLGPELRKQMKEAGITTPGIAATGSEDVCQEDDAAKLFENSSRTATTPDMAEAVNPLSWRLQERFGLSPAQAEGLAEWHAKAVKEEVQRETSLQLNRVIGFLLLPGNLLVRAHALAHASRMAGLSGIRSLRHSAEICRFSVEGVRKVAWKWVELLHLPSLEGAKSPAAKESYRQDKTTNHWRHQKCTKDNLKK